MLQETSGFPFAIRSPYKNSHLQYILHNILKQTYTTIMITTVEMLLLFLVLSLSSGAEIFLQTQRKKKDLTVVCLDKKKDFFCFCFVFLNNISVM